VKHSPHPLLLSPSTEYPWALATESSDGWDHQQLVQDLSLVEDPPLVDESPPPNSTCPLSFNPPHSTTSSTIQAYVGFHILQSTGKNRTSDYFVFCPKEMTLLLTGNSEWQWGRFRWFRAQDL